MSYQFKKSRKPAAEMKRVLKERIEHAIDALMRYPLKDVEGLHTARRDIKKVRSLLLLLRAPGLRGLSKSLNEQLRRTAAHLSAHRDREVLGNLMDCWLKQPEVRRNPSLKSAVSALAGFYKPEGTAHPLLDPAVQQNAADRLAQIAQEVRAADLSQLNWKSIERSARKQALRMQTAREAYLEIPSAETLHEWRKQVKHHYFHLCLLKRFDPPAKHRRQPIRRLENRLGKARDLDLLLTSLREAQSLPVGIRELGVLLEFTEHAKERLLVDDRVTVPRSDSGL